MPRTIETIFFDRDDTLCHVSLARKQACDRALGRILGRPDFCLSEDANRQVLVRLQQTPGLLPARTRAQERRFWTTWFELILTGYGLKAGAARHAASLYRRFPFHKRMELFPETAGVLRELKRRGYRLGVISDTFPSLKASLQALRIAGFFKSCTASSLVGASKPDPRIFQAALKALRAKPERSVFVDDNKLNADGARAQGFVAFHLDRRLPEPAWDTWTIGNLTHLLRFERLQR
jgi:putative hydrolase of the HAD superfamily